MNLYSAPDAQVRISFKGVLNPNFRLFGFELRKKLIYIGFRDL